MTAGDSRDAFEAVPPLRAARHRAGWTQAAAMRRFAAAATEFGAVPPSGASLKRMFAYWEAGEREVTVAAYRDAFCSIYGAPPEALGFERGNVLDGSERGHEQSLNLICADDTLIALLEVQTQHLRLVDRRLGSAVRAAMVEEHARRLEQLLHLCVGPLRGRLAAALSEAAALAGWLALDRCDTRASWQWHELARGAATESGSAAHLGHVLAQQAIVLLDAEQVTMAREAATQASRLVAGSTPALVEAWVAATEAEVLSASGESDAANRRFDHARNRFEHDAAEVPFIMLSAAHLDRWQGHCLARQGGRSAVAVLRSALAADGDSVRAATSLHTDIALALLHAGEHDEAVREGELALGLADRCGSRRQARRLRAVVSAAKGKHVQQAD